MAEVLLNSTLPTVSAAPIESVPPPFPDHTQLPESDGTFVKNFQEHPQALILTDSLASVTSDRRGFTLSPINLVIPPVSSILQLTTTAKSWADAEAEAVGIS